MDTEREANYRRVVPDFGSEIRKRIFESMRTNTGTA